MKLKKIIEKKLGNLYKKYEELIEKDYAGKLDVNSSNSVYDEITIMASNIEENINSLEEILKRLSNPKDKGILTKEDFAIIYKIFVEDPSVKDITKKNIMKEFIRQNTTSKEKNEVVGLDQVKELLATYGVLRVTIDRLDSFKDEIIKNADLDKMKEILEYLTSVDELSKKTNIVNCFGESVLISILLYGDVEQLRRVYNYQIAKYGQILGIYLETPSFWINNLSKSKKGKKPILKEGKRNLIPVLYSAIHETSIADMELNEKFLQSKGFNVSIAEGGNVKVLKKRHNVIKDNYEAYRLYGIIDNQNLYSFSISSLSFNNVLEHMDNLVELGLLDDYLTTGRPENAYAIMYPSIIQNLNQEEILFLYHLKATSELDDYYDSIFSKKYLGMLTKTDIRSLMKNAGLNKKTSDKYKAEYFVDLATEIPNYNIFLECIYDLNIIIHDDGILNDSMIQELENNYKVTKYSYQFGNQVISRLKVLRNFTALMKNGYNDENALLFSITFGSFIDSETLNIIKGSLNRGGQR